MRRTLYCLTISFALAAPTQALDGVDFDRLFRAASGPALPEPPSAESIPAPVGTSVATPKTDSKQPGQLPAPPANVPSLTPPLNAPQAPAPQAPVRQVPEARVDLNALPPGPPLPAPSAPIESYGSQAQPMYAPVPQEPAKVGSQEHSVLAAPSESTDRIDFAAVLASCKDPAPCAAPPMQPAPQVCMVGGCEMPRPCNDCGPIRGMIPVSFEDYYRCPPCYRSLWGSFGYERAKHCTCHHGHLQGTCGCECCR